MKRARHRSPTGPDRLRGAREPADLRPGFLVHCTLGAVLVAYALAQEPTPPAQGPGRLSLVEPELDFGTVFQGPDVIAVFVAANRGSGPLRILDVTRFGCGVWWSRVNELSDTRFPIVLQPGETMTLETGLHTTRIGGPHHRQFVIRSDDPENPEQKVTLRGIVRPAWEIARELDLGTVPRENGSAARVIAISVEPESGITAFRAESSSPFLEVRPVRASPEAGDAPDTRFSVRVLPDAPPGAFKATIHLSCERTEFPFRTVKVDAWVEGRVRLSQRLLNFGSGPPGSFTDREVQISTAGPPLDAGVIEVTPSGVWKWQVQSIEGGGATTLKIRPDDGIATPGLLSGRVTIRTAVAGEEVQHVYLWARIVGPSQTR